jgi:hypothetical protein
LKEVADRPVAGQPVGEGQVVADRVTVASTVAFPLQIAGVVELADDPVGGALGDADLVADVAQAAVDPLAIRSLYY